MKKARKPLAVLISDVHFSTSNLSLAADALNQALDEAYELQVPLIIAGDLNDTKAVIRGEVANCLISIFSKSQVPVIILVGNHDMLNEKGSEHSLNFLRPYAYVCEHPETYQGFNYTPSHNDPETFLSTIRRFNSGSLVICHQGFRGAHMGEYVIDKTSVDPSEISEYRVISGHYHRHQTIGTVTYIGTPYTITAAEANDGVKGILVLYDDHTFDRVGLKLRRHVTVERTIETAMDPIEGLRPVDLLWLKVSGPATELQKLSKKEIGMRHLGHQNFKLDKIYAEVKAIQVDRERHSDDQIFDKVIEASDESASQKKYLKKLWRELFDETA